MLAAVVGCLLATLLQQGSAAVYDVTAFGAKGDGKTYDTVAVRSAASALAAAGGGTLLFPAGSAASGNRFLTGAFNLSGNATLIVEEGATILASQVRESAATHCTCWSVVDMFGVCVFVSLCLCVHWSSEGTTTL
jgi:polygalacturonase